MQPQGNSQPPIVIDNLGSLGLSRRLHGSLKSGFLKYLTSFGIDPFTKPGALGWQEQLVTIDSGHATLADMIVQMKIRLESGVPYVYALDYSGNLYKITISNDSISKIASTSLNLKYGGGIDFEFVSNEELYIGNDAGLSYINFDGTGQTAITAGVTWIANVPRPMKQFNGVLYVGNDTNIVQVTAGAVTNGATITPSLPQNYHILDLDVSADGVYLKILANRLSAPDLKTTDPVNYSAGVETQIFYWNGSDTFITSQEIFPSMSGTSIHTFGQTAMMAGYDFLGGMMRDENQKIVTMPVTNPPLSSCIDSSGDIALFATRDYLNAAQNISIFALGTTDSYVQAGFWRLHMQAASATYTDVNTVGAFAIVQNLSYPTSVTGSPPLTTSKFYVSTYEIKGAGNTFQLYKGTLTPQGTGTPILGVAETETEFFPQRVQFALARVYCDPTVSGNGFKLNLVDSGGSLINITTSAGTDWTYTYASGTDPTQLQGAQTVIEFPIQMNPVQACSVRLTNTGTSAMFIHKIELEPMLVQK